MRSLTIQFCKQDQYYKLILCAICFLVAANASAITLEDAIELALEVDPTVRASKLNQMGLEENIVIARSRFFPQVVLQGSSSQITQTTSQDLATGGSASRSFTGPSVNHQFFIRQALIRPKELSAIRSAELQGQYMDLKFQNDVSELKSRVVNSWIDLLGAQKLAKAYKRPLPFLEDAATQERYRFENGDGTKDAVLEASAQYVGAKATYIQALETLKAKQFSFERLTNIPAIHMVNQNFDLVPKPLILESEKLAVWERVRDTSLELQMAQLQERIQMERVKNAEADHKPTLDLMFALNLAQNDATSTQGYQYKNKQFGMQYSVPIYSGGSASSAVRQANFLSESSKLETEALKIKFQIEFESNWGQLVGLGYRILANYDSFKSVETQLQATKRQIELGVKSISDLAVIEATYARRLSELVTITQDYLKINHKLKIKI
jgi:outer membrane protein TolC